MNTNGFSAEIGRAGGGVINVVTKSGAEHLSRQCLRVLPRPRAERQHLHQQVAWNRAPALPLQPVRRHGGRTHQKDKICFFLSYDGQRNLNPNPVFFNFTVPSDAQSQAGAAELAKYLTPYTTGYRNNIGLAKVDWNLSNTQRLSVRLNIHRFTGINFENGGSQSAQEHTGNSLVSTNSLAVNYSKVFGSAVVFDSRFNWVKDDEPGEANSTAPETVVNQSGGSFTFGRNNFSPRYTNSKRYQFIESVSYLRGKHAYKIGGDLNFERIDNFFPGNFYGRLPLQQPGGLRRPAAIVQFTQGFAGAGTDGPLTKPNIKEFALFVQDAWRVTDRLTLNYGYRYDIASYAQPSVLNPDAGLAAQGLATNRINTDTNNHAPRFGFAYRLRREGPATAARRLRDLLLPHALHPHRYGDVPTGSRCRPTR
ncbi:MAG: TonB-dependent receptor [Paludibaculum sp.]